MKSLETPPPHSTDARASRAEAPALADLLRERTRVLHTRAERSGVIADLLHGRATRRAHALLLRNLLPAYESLEQGLERHRSEPRMAALAQPCVYRSAAIESDLCAVVGGAWAADLPLLPEAERYAARVGAAAAGRGALLLAHAYTRFLGDLNGGRVVARVLGESLGLEPGALRFYAYDVPDPRALRDDYRRAIDAAADPGDVDAIAAEACAAFELNVELSEAVRRADSR